MIIGELALWAVGRRSRRSFLALLLFSFFPSLYIVYFGALRGEYRVGILFDIFLRCLSV